MRELEKANCFVLLELLKAIPDLEKTTTNEDIEMQLRKTLISTQGYQEYALDIPSETTALDPELEADFISFEGLDNIDELV